MFDVQFPWSSGGRGALQDGQSAVGVMNPTREPQRWKGPRTGARMFGSLSKGRVWRGRQKEKPRPKFRWAPWAIWSQAPLLCDFVGHVYLSGPHLLLHLHSITLPIWQWRRLFNTLELFSLGLEDRNWVLLFIWNNLGLWSFLFSSFFFFFYLYSFLI